MLRRLALVLSVGLVGSCAIVRTARTEAALFPYIGSVVYPLSRRTIFQLAMEDAQRAYREGTNNFFFAAGRLMGAEPRIQVRCAPEDRPELGKYSPLGEGVAVLDERHLVIPGVPRKPDEDPEPSQPIEIWGFSEVYVLEKVDDAHTRVRIENKADRRPLPSRELKFFATVDRPGAEALKRRIEREHPEITLED